MVPIVATTGHSAAQDSGSRAAVANGRALVERSKCLDCHRIGDRGSRLGPTLTDIGNLRSREELRDALVAPDQDVLPEHRSVRLVTKDGATIVGRLLNQDAFSIQLMNADEQLKSYARSNLREQTIVTKGLMPSYEGKLTSQEIADVVNYLASLPEGEDLDRGAEPDAGARSGAARGARAAELAHLRRQLFEPAVQPARSDQAGERRAV